MKIDKRHMFGITQDELKRMAIIVLNRPDLQMMSVGDVTHKALDEWFTNEEKKIGLSKKKEKENALFEISSRVEAKPSVYLSLRGVEA